MLSVEGLTQSYGAGSAPVLRGVDLHVEAGQSVALVGSNGSGKSTLLKCCIGLHANTGGHITLFGERFTQQPSENQKRLFRRQSGFIFQKHCLVRRMSVLSNVVHGLLGRPGSWRGFCHALAPAEWRDRAMLALAKVNLANRASDRVDSLSGGQQQRVAIARALVAKPLLILADEPAASLDPKSGNDVMSMFTKLASEEGIALLFSSHDMRHARTYAQRVVALRDGRVQFNESACSVSDAMLNATFAVTDAR